jgi:hypothetical protein
MKSRLSGRNSFGDEEGISWQYPPKRPSFLGRLSGRRPSKSSKSAQLIDPEEAQELQKAADLAEAAALATASLSMPAAAEDTRPTAAPVSTEASLLRVSVLLPPGGHLSVEVDAKYRVMRYLSTLSPAELAGVELGDQICRINGKSVFGTDKTLAELVAHMRVGDEPVVLGLRRGVADDDDDGAELATDTDALSPAPTTAAAEAAVAEPSQLNNAEMLSDAAQAPPAGMVHAWANSNTASAVGAVSDEGDDENGIWKLIKSGVSGLLCAPASCAPRSRK